MIKNGIDLNRPLIASLNCKTGCNVSPIFKSQCKPPPLIVWEAVFTRVAGWPWLTHWINGWEWDSHVSNFHIMSSSPPSLSPLFTRTCWRPRRALRSRAPPTSPPAPWPRADALALRSCPRALIPRKGSMRLTARVKALHLAFWQRHPTRGSAGHGARCGIRYAWCIAR